MPVVGLEGVAGGKGRAEGEVVVEEAGKRAHDPGSDKSRNGLCRSPAQQQREEQDQAEDRDGVVDGHGEREKEPCQGGDLGRGEGIGL